MLTLKRIITPRERHENKASRARNAELRTLKRLAHYYATREPNVPFELDTKEIELTRKAISHYLAEQIVGIETR